MNRASGFYRSTIHILGNSKTCDLIYLDENYLMLHSKHAYTTGFLNRMTTITCGIRIVKIASVFLQRNKA